MTDVLIVLLMIVPIFPVATAGILLWHRSWRHGSPSLSERTMLALRDSTVGVVVALLAANRVFMWNFPREAVLMATAVVLLLVSLPSAYWLWLFMRGSFRR